MAGFTFSEKILNARAGTIICKEPDIILSHDNSARIRKLFRRMGGEKISCPEKLLVVLDRKINGQMEELVRDYKLIHDFMNEQQVERFFDCNTGICHQVLVKYLKPGLLVTGNDSHTATAGAFNCFAVGLNKTETAYLWKTAKMWFRVPETVKIVLKGSLRPGVYAKDVALWIMGMLREEFVEYKTIEYHGEGVKTLSLADRMTIANVSEEMGIKNSVFPPDDVLADYFNDYAIKGIWADMDAVYYKEFTVDLGNVIPLIMFTHDHSEVKSLGESEGLEIQQGFIGACSNGRIEDLRVVADILNNKRIAPGFQLFVIPASYEIYLQARKEGLIDKILKSGASVLGASCSPCTGSTHIVSATANRFVTTTNSNAMRRFAELGVEKYVASPATIARIALSGKIEVEEEFAGEKYQYWNLPVKPVVIDDWDNRHFGRIWYYGDINYISCKQIFPDSLTHKLTIENTEELVPYLFRDFDRSFAGKVSTGDVIIAGECFGVGRLIKHSVSGLLASGIKAVLVKSANRQFFRMAINLGLPVYVVPELISAYREGDILELDLVNNRIVLNGKIFILPVYDAFIQNIWNKKGIKHICQ